MKGENLHVREKRVAGFVSTHWKLQVHGSLGILVHGEDIFDWDYGFVSHATDIYFH